MVFDALVRPLARRLAHGVTRVLTGLALIALALGGVAVAAPTPAAAAPMTHTSAALTPAAPATVAATPAEAGVGAVSPADDSGAVASAAGAEDRTVDRPAATAVIAVVHDGQSYRLVDFGYLTAGSPSGVSPASPLGQRAPPRG